METETEITIIDSTTLWSRDGCSVWVPSMVFINKRPTGDLVFGVHVYFSGFNVGEQIVGKSMEYIKLNNSGRYAMTREMAQKSYDDYIANAESSWIKDGPKIHLGDGRIVGVFPTPHCSPEIVFHIREFNMELKEAWTEYLGNRML